MNEIILNQSLLEDINISITSSLIAMSLSIFSALIIRFLYLNFGRSLNNREYFGNIFMLLSVATCSVIIIVKYSLALSLGLVGALSIVRFRAAIKEPEELVYLFLVIALGLSFGANQFLIGIILLAISSVIIVLSAKLIFSKKAYDHTGILIIFSGERTAIESLRSKELSNISNINTLTILKEVEYTEAKGKIVLKASMNEEMPKLIERFERISNDKNLDLNIISDVTVPA
tara:strand:- start:69 stop:761 length:693 start_codon:yes stop_codon:yes gene_type:complete